MQCDSFGLGGVIGSVSRVDHPFEHRLEVGIICINYEVKVEWVVCDVVAGDNQRSVFAPTKIGLAKMYARNVEVNGFENNLIKAVAGSNPFRALGVVIIHHVCYNLFIIYGGFVKIKANVGHSR